jgi:hypothetical protein
MAMMLLSGRFERLRTTEDNRLSSSHRLTDRVFDVDHGVVAALLTKEVCGKAV